MNYNSRILCFFILLFLFKIGYSQNEKINHSFSCKNSNRIYKTTQDNIEFNKEDFLHKNLEIVFKNVDMEIGSGIVQILDKDRNQYFQFDILNILSDESGFFKLPNENNETFAASVFKVDSGTSIAKMFLFFHTETDKFLLMIRSNHKKENTDFYVENWYIDLKPF